MFPHRIKVGAFTLEALNSISATYYFYYVFFFLKEHFGFGSRENLVWAIVHGAVYVVGSWQGGRYGQRRGYLRAIRFGFAGMAACFLAGWLVSRAGLPRTPEILVQAALMVVATASICFTWPNLEAVVSEGEPGRRLQRLIGIYNLVWSAAGALAYFTGGVLIEALGARQLVLLVPGVMIAGQYLLADWLERQPGARGAHAGAAGHGPVADDAERHRSALSPETFLRMAWLANPCAYVAINAAIPQIPSLADRLGLGPAAAGVFCSLWLFVRAAAFAALWRWNGWHYRFGWLAASFAGMILGFLFIFLSTSLPGLSRPWALAVASGAQVVFGAALGLIYYSSLFYSMDVGDTKGDHGGLHEAAIGCGILGGPLVGAAAQFARPGSATAPAWAVSAVLVLGLGVLFVLRHRGRARA